MINQDMLTEARKIVSNARITLPAEIPGFAGFFVAKADDSSIETISGFVGENSISYKIGTKGAS